VDEDGDVNQAIPRIIAGGFGNSGQTCISVQRVYVHKNIFKDFLAKLIPAVEKLKLGHPLSDDTDISSMISHKDAVRVIDWIEEAKRGGAKVLTGGEAKGNTVKPTVLTSVKPDMKVSCMELFGPAIVVGEYDTIDEAISLVNNSRYGLQAGIYTKDLNKALLAARRLEVGGVMINDVPTYRADHMPYGGVKDSGSGREGLRYAVEEMTERKLVCIKLG
jgi:acyl-CoA reductase-like NAD-dependent aldehyde dehydrogenase